MQFVDHFTCNGPILTNDGLVLPWDKQTEADDKEHRSAQLSTTYTSDSVSFTDSDDSVQRKIDKAFSRSTEHSTTPQDYASESDSSIDLGPIKKTTTKKSAKSAKKQQSKKPRKKPVAKYRGKKKESVTKVEATTLQKEAPAEGLQTLNQGKSFSNAKVRDYICIEATAESLVQFVDHFTCNGHILTNNGLVLH